MRKIVAGLFISLDGVVEAPDQWHFPYFNDEMGAAVNATLGAADTVLFGARPTTASRGHGLSARWRVARMRVPQRFSATSARSWCSNQRLGFTWRNSEQLEGDLVETVNALKTEPGGIISLSGSVSVVRQLLAACLVDELHLSVHPIAVRKGMRLFDKGETPMPLRLISSEAFKTGVLNLVYGPAESSGEATARDV